MVVAVDQATRIQELASSLKVGSTHLQVRSDVITLFQVSTRLIQLLLASMDAAYGDLLPTLRARDPQPSGSKQYGLDVVREAIRDSQHQWERALRTLATWPAPRPEGDPHGSHR